MNDKYINEIYWDSGAHAYYYGSRIQSSAKRRIKFTNQLMEAGDEIISWTSSTNYQAEKLTPALPILQANHQYQLLVGVKTEPSQTVMTRLEFFNVQGDRIKKIEFLGTSRKFVYPVGSFSYRISLINTGAVSLEFSRLQIGSARFSRDAFADIWFQQGGPVKTSMPDLTLYVVQEGVHSRCRYSAGNGRPHTDFAWQVASIAWQFDGDAAAVIQKRLAKEKRGRVHVISTMPETDSLAVQLTHELPNADCLLTNQSGQADLPTYDLGDQPAWRSPETTDPDWLTINEAVRQQWKGGRTE